MAIEMSTSRESDEEAGVSRRGVRQIVRTSFPTQANALLRKNLTYQRRNFGTNCCLVLMPVALCVLLLAIQVAINALLSNSKYQCGCKCLEYNGAGECINNQCGLQYSTGTQVAFCPVPHPPQWPAFQQIGPSQFRAVQNSVFNSPDLPPASCRTSPQGCPVILLYTAANRTLGDGIASFILKPPSNRLALSSEVAQGNYLPELAASVPATTTSPFSTWLLEPAVASFDDQAPRAVFLLQQSCRGQRSQTRNFSFSLGSYNVSAGFECLVGKTLWRPSSAGMNAELYSGYVQRFASQPVINEYGAAYDFRTSGPGRFDANVWYNYTYANAKGGDGPPTDVFRFPRALNLASNAFVRYATGGAASLALLFVKDFPKGGTTLSLDFSSLLGPLFYMWLLQLLLPVRTRNLYPVILSAVVYEKERRLRMMMKMQGLGDSPYWVVTYAYFLALSLLYMFFFILIGSAVGLNFFRSNSYAIQIIFFFVFVNTQLAFAILASTLFARVPTANVCAYLYVFGSGLLGQFLFRYLLQDPTFPRGAIFAMELVPAFALFRCLYELSQYSFLAAYQNGRSGMQFADLSSPQNGMVPAVAILLVEWAVFLLVALYLDQVVSSENGLKRPPLFFLHGWLLPSPSKTHSPPLLPQGTSVEAVDDSAEDVERERLVVDGLGGGTEGYAIVCDQLRKVYPPSGGTPEKVAVRGLSMAIPRGECFGLLGSNGAGKTTSINMMIGFLEPSSGSCTIEGMDIRRDMKSIYSVLGVCPQHDLLWEQLTGREHLLFYGRLKNLSGPQLHKAVDESLASVNLLSGGVGNKRVSGYSGGMKRRLSVAISLIGDPLVVYMDEPSTGLDPASRMNLWAVVKAAKKDRAIILTTHSMEEAEALCDRLGIFESGSFQCIGNPKELTSRYGGHYLLTMTTPVEEEEKVLRLVKSVSSNARRVYSLAGTQKFELPTDEVDISDVFVVVERAQEDLHIQAWGISNTTLEDVFIKIATRGKEVTLS